MDHSTEFKTLQDSITSSLLSTTRTATHISSEDLGFHRSLDPALATSLDRQNARLLGLAERLLKNVAPNQELPKLRDADALDGNWSSVVDMVDSLLERADTSLDEYTGVVKKAESGNELGPESMKGRPNPTLRPIALAKPQEHFENIPKNDETEPFIPLLTWKPHATVPLKHLQKARNELGADQYEHPYRREIENYSYPASVYTISQPIGYLPFESTSATFVDTPEALAAMLAELKTANEIAVDLEHHDNRSYIGITCLMQISTRNKDWIIDTLKPWRRRLECLNEVFADPNILKVLHGSHSDVIWLQRDFGIYIVGLFDTYVASRTLGYVAGSYAYLLQKFANVTAQKQYQMSDWRIRPLPSELIDYARSDTHYLLYIYDRMRNELVERSDFNTPDNDRVTRVLEGCKEIALRRYEFPFYDDDRGVGPIGWYKLLFRTPAMFNKEQFSVFKAVHRWRDSVARMEDESNHYVMANHSIFSIAREMPVDKAKLLAVGAPISAPTRRRLDDLLAVIAKAKEEGVDGPEMVDAMNESAKIAGFSAAPVTAPLNTAIIPKIAVENASTAPLSVGSVVRSTISKFWGGTFDSSIWGKGSAVDTDNMSLAVPLPRLTAEIFADAADAEDARPQQSPNDLNPAARAEHAYVKNRPAPAEQEDVFIIKQLGKRKRAEAVMPLTDTPSDQVSAQAEEEEIEVLSDAEILARGKAQRKAEKKAARKLKKEAGANVENATSENLAETVPFDYEKAESVLHAAKESLKKENTRSKEFNPYAKAMDAPKGLSRKQKERAGRSATFKE
ncbi:hypothetical protein M501DRAFT_1004233 [Patellaria atrata CBS 101060]|uniref:HRDC domain-containing protein n=1 Tax=Patellaria atrata CBS 101060 TaxID=1346257 RepID=A0A9P4S9G8_9PEZI|nr:hypothetical protein M501DRAFT_1004233 [Patellaria atrata CBS 101060]